MNNVKKIVIGTKEYHVNYYRDNYDAGGVETSPFLVGDAASCFGDLFPSFFDDHFPSFFVCKVVTDFEESSAISTLGAERLPSRPGTT